MSEVRACFAYSQSRERCDMPAGHPGDHSITLTWTDEECFDPTAPIDMSEYRLPDLNVVRPVPDEEPVVFESCVACDHPHPWHEDGGACSLNDCGCMRYV
jgi:hypothetical protein